MLGPIALGIAPFRQSLELLRIEPSLPLILSDFCSQVEDAFCRILAMNGNPKVIEQLNRALRDELTAINQYFLHAEMAK